MSKNISTERRNIEAQEDLVIDAQYLLHDLMVERGITRAELAERLGISKARLSQIFSAKANPTLKTVAELFFALGESVKLERGAPLAIPQSKLDASWIEDEHPALVETVSSRKATCLIAAVRAIPRLHFSESPANDCFPPSIEQLEAA